MSKENGKGGMGGKVLAAGIAVCLVANLGLGAYQLQKDVKDNKKVSKFIDNQLEKQAKEAEKENTYEEDGYVVGDAYEIISTKKISDAYLSGDDSKLNEEDKETLEMATKVLEKVTKDCKTNYEKEVAIYEWMYKNIGQGSSTRVMMPTTDSNEYTPHGVLSGKNAVCVGYATTFRLFMNMLGMECHIVHNDYHSWDLVQLDDDQWYHIDIYSDVSGSCEYKNFNMTDGIARSEHEWDGSALPEAKGEKYLYPVQHAKEVKDLYAVPKLLKKALGKKQSGVYCKFKTKFKEEDYALADVMISQVYNAMMQTSDYENADISAVWYPDGEDNYVLAAYFSYYDNDSENTDAVDKKVKKKMAQMIKQAFGVDVSDVDDYDDYAE